MNEATKKAIQEAQELREFVRLYKPTGWNGTATIESVIHVPFDIYSLLAMGRDYPAVQEAINKYYSQEN